MEQVEIRELKNRLSHYVRRARAGHAIQITDGGEVVAELRPASRSVAGADTPQRLAELARRGLVRLGAPNDRRIYRGRPSVCSMKNGASAEPLRGVECRPLVGPRAGFRRVAHRQISEPRV